MQTVKQEGRVLEFDRQADRVRAGQEEIGERGRFREARRRERDVVEGGEEEAGAGFGDGDRGEARGEEAGFADGAAADVVGGGGGGRGAQGAAAVGGFASVVGRGGEAGDGGLVNVGLVVEEDVDVVEAGAEFKGQDFELDVGLHHGEDVLLNYD